MIALLRHVVDAGAAEGARWANLWAPKVKRDLLAEFGASSKLYAEWEFVWPPRAEGRRAASECLDAHAEDLGKRSTAITDLLFADA